MATDETKFARFVIFINCLVPVTLLGWDLLHHRLGANPLEFVTRTTGILILTFLLLTLTITPIRKITGWNWLIKFRRMLGLFAFFYGTLHFITYIWFDRGFNLTSTIQDIAKRPFIAVGMTSYFLLIPLAITSTNNWIRRLGGKRWNRLHKLIYVAAAGGVIHFYMLVKSDVRLPIAFGSVLAILLCFRLVKAYWPKASHPASATQSSS
ncbi:MAG TPA: protein-methionine-sulfoxide reductase heme-binding subunit MsrQ [Acidobacteriota bacterium]|nr:protein-methionine-sulfoxide reductase heme-binding subunit MsrQ [Acidobacteriota bacterium]